jgi:hypothetical protein
LPRLSDSAGAAAVESALDAIGIGRFHLFLLLCVSLIWAGEQYPAVTSTTLCVPRC